MEETEFRKKVLDGVTSLGEQIKGCEKQIAELEKAKGDPKIVDGLKIDLKGVQDNINTLTTELAQLRKRSLITRTALAPNMPGRVSDACARALAGQVIVHAERSGKFDGWISQKSVREAMLDQARNALDIDVKTALSTSDIPLPIEYFGEIRELISQFGVVRRQMFPFPIGMGTAKPARMGTRPAFGSIAMSAAFTEKSPTVTFAALESHKIGGLVRLPREIDEQSIVPMGQFMARYGAVEFARAEDTWGFLADGSGTYESVSGIVTVAAANSKVVTLASTKTHPSDATIADFRAMRPKVNKAALNAKLSAYYLDSTWEAQLRTFNTNADLFIYVRNADGSATLDGYPIIWTDVLQAYDTSVHVSAYIAVFGALSFWWMGEHGSPRIDTSEHVFFANDQLAVRFIEEIDFDYNAVDATSALQLAAS